MIKAIETHYNGYRFRSRLEARWAVFFNAADIPYVYEPEGFVSSTGEHYLPDFYLPHLTTNGCYAEVKPNVHDRIPEVIKAAKVMCGEAMNQLIILGEIPNVTDCGIMMIPMFGYDAIYGEVVVRKIQLLNQGGQFYLEHHLPIGPFGNIYALEHGNFDLEITSCKSWEKSDPMGYWTTEDPFERELSKKCFLVARTARFEHGETPTIFPVIDNMVV